MRPQLVWYRHAAVLADALQAVADGQIRRLLVLMPPRHGKSLLVSQLFPAYLLARDPATWVGLVSYTAELAQDLSRNARDAYLAGGGTLRGDSAAVRRWQTAGGGGLWAAGMGGAITGRGFSVGIIDDPLKNAQAADSPVIRRRQQDWYQSTFLTRGEPDAAIVEVQTRWHEDDLAGWLLAQEAVEDEAEGWTVLHLPAIAEAEPTAYPPSCTLLPDWRAPGEALCPERYDTVALERRRVRLGPYFWSALFQGSPTSAGGTLFKREHLGQVLDAVPADLVLTARFYDLAASIDGDYTCGVKLGLRASGALIVLDVLYDRLEPTARDALVLATSQADGPTCLVRFEQEGGSGGKAQVVSLVRRLPGFDAAGVVVSGDKTLRARPFAAQVGADNVALLRGDWNAWYVDLLARFPAARHDDPVDASAGALAALTQYAGAAQTAPSIWR